MLFIRRFLSTLPSKCFTNEITQHSKLSFKYFTFLHDPIKQILQLTNSISSPLPISLNTNTKISNEFIDNEIIPDLKNSIITSRLYDPDGYLVEKSKLASSLTEQIIICSKKFKLIDFDTVPFKDSKISLCWKHKDTLINVNNSNSIILCNKKPIKLFYDNRLINLTKCKKNDWNNVYSPYFGLYNDEKQILNYNEPNFYEAGYYPNVFFYYNQKNSEINHVMTQGFIAGMAHAINSALRLNNISYSDFTEAGYSLEEPIKIPSALLLNIMHGKTAHQFAVQINTLNFKSMHGVKNQVSYIQRTRIFKYDPINIKNFKNSLFIRKRYIEPFNTKRIAEDINMKGIRNMIMNISNIENL